MTWLAGPLLRARGERLRASSRASRTTRTRRRSTSGTPTTASSRARRTTRSTTRRTTRRPSRSPCSARWATRRTRTGRFTGGLRWFDHTRTRDYFIQTPNGHFTANLGTAEEIDERHHQEAVRAVQLHRRRDGVRALLRRLPRRRPQRRASRHGAAAGLRAGLPRQLRARLQEPLDGRPPRAEPDRVPDGMERLPGRGRGPGSVVRRRWSRTSATPRSTASASTSARSCGIRSTSA